LCIGYSCHISQEENSISADSGKFCGTGDFVTLVCDAERDCEIHTFSRQSRGIGIEMHFLKGNGLLNFAPRGGLRLH